MLQRELFGGGRFYMPMDFVLLNNTLATWSIAVGAALGSILAMLFLRLLIARRLAVLAQRTATRLDDLAVQMLGSTYVLAIIVLGLYLGSTFLDLPAKAQLMLSRIAVAALLIQLAIWGDAGVRAWRGRQQRQLEAADTAASTTSISIISFVLRTAVWIVITLMLLDNLGFNVTTLVASLGISGIAVALAVQNILGDLFASLSIVLDKPFVVGDFIIVGDELGAVESIGLKTTRLRGLGGEQIVFSNAELLKSRIHNHQRMVSRRVAFIVRVGYQTEEQQLRAIPGIVRELVMAQPNTRFERAHFSAYSDSSLDFEVVYHVGSSDYLVHMDTQQAVFLGLYRRFAIEGIEFAHPLRMVQFAGLNGARRDTAEAALAEFSRRR